MTISNRCDNHGSSCLKVKVPILRQIEKELIEVLIAKQSVGIPKWDRCRGFKVNSRALLDID